LLVFSHLFMTLIPLVILDLDWVLLIHFRREPIHTENSMGRLVSGIYAFLPNGVDQSLA
jgi:hypothetical protein